MIDWLTMSNYHVYHDKICHILDSTGVYLTWLKIELVDTKNMVYYMPKGLRTVFLSLSLSL